MLLRHTQEIRGTLSWLTIEAHIQKIFFRLVCRPEKNYSSFVQYQHAMEMFVDIFRSLVERADGRFSKNVGHDAKTLNVIEGGSGIET